MASVMAYTLSRCHSGSIELVRFASGSDLYSAYPRKRFLGRTVSSPYAAICYPRFGKEDSVGARIK